MSGSNDTFASVCSVITVCALSIELIDCSLGRFEVSYAGAAPKSCGLADPGKDVCLIKHQPIEKLSLTMNPVRKIKKFSKLKRGDFVRTFGTPEGLPGHTAEGTIIYLGKKYFKDMDKDTNFIVHDATIDRGSSGGPLFDKNGYLIGLNTLKSGNMYFSVSADYILEMIK